MNCFFLNTGKPTESIEIDFCARGTDAEHPVEIINAMGEELMMSSSA
jgi:hypothetical protein